MKQNGAKRTRLAPWILLGILLALLLPFVAVRMVQIHRRQQAAREFWAQAAQFSESKQPWEECAIPLPERLERLVFLRRRLHPFLGEYRRHVRVERPGQADVMLPLPLNTGGRTHISVYWVAARDDFGPFVLLRDHTGDHLLDLAADQTLQIVRHLDDVYIDVLAGDPNGDVLDDSSSYSPSSPEASGLRDITADGVFDRATHLGRIDGRRGPLRYVPADEAAEEKTAGSVNHLELGS